MISKLKPPFAVSRAVLQIQSVLFNNTLQDTARAVEALARATELAVAAGVVSRVILRYGDSSSVPALDERDLATLRRISRGFMQVDYDYFQGNLGSARGHNRLAACADLGTDFIWIQNPEVIVCPRIFEMVLEPFSRSGVGQVEAKQIPIEHPKDYSPITGETVWTSTACVMTPLSLFNELGGFDADTFFLYCDDVDFSFRIREAGLSTIFQPAAVCFHDKRLADDATWQTTSSERYYSAEASLMMAHKWSRPDLVEDILGHFVDSGDPDFEKAATFYLTRRRDGSLPAPRDPQHKIAKFHGYNYARHRFEL